MIAEEAFYPRFEKERNNLRQMQQEMMVMMSVLPPQTVIKENDTDERNKTRTAVLSEIAVRDSIC